MNMKKNYLFLVALQLFFVIGFTGCSDDDEGGGIAGDPNELLVGTWELIHSEVQGYVDGQWVDESVPEGDYFLTFTDDNKFIDNDGSVYLWRINGNVLSWDGDDYTIEKLNAEEMVLSFTEDDGTYFERWTFRKTTGGNIQEPDDDEDDVPGVGGEVDRNRVIGEWQSVAVNVYEIIGGEKSVIAEGPYTTATWIFKESGRGIMADTSDDSSLYMDWHMLGDVIVINVDGEEEKYTITSLSDDTLVTVYTEEGEGYFFYAEYTFRRVE